MLEEIGVWVVMLGTVFLPLASIVLGVFFLVRGVRTRRIRFMLLAAFFAFVVPAIMYVGVIEPYWRPVIEDILMHIGQVY
jgi:hypothetical protein